MATGETTLGGRGHSGVRTYANEGSPFSEIPIEFYPAYIAYFHALASSGVGDHANGSYTLKVYQVDRRCNDNMDQVDSITLDYEKEK